MENGRSLKRLVGIAIALCSVSLVATIPAIGADAQAKETSATASVGNYILEIYGNANEDDAIDMRDATYTKLIIFGERPATKLVNAIPDDGIDVEDVMQVELIILERASEITIVDAKGNNETVPLPLNEIVVLNSDVTEAVRALGGKDRIIGISNGIAKHKRLFPDISTRTSVGGCWTPDVEKIIALNSDAVFAYGRWPGPSKLEDRLVGTNISVVRLDFYKFGRLEKEMDILGYLLEIREGAERYLEWYDESVTRIEEKVAGITEAEKPKVFLDGSGTRGTRDTYSKESGAHDLCTAAGGINIAADIKGVHPDVPTEWIITENPEVIVGISFSYKGGYETNDETELRNHHNDIIGLPGIENVTAVRNNSVYIICDDVAYAPVMPVALSYMAKWLHPTLFEDLDPQELHQEYINKFCSIDFNVSEEGVFVYP